MGRNKTVKDLAAAGDCPDCGGAGYLRRDLPVDDPDFGRPVACRCRQQVRQQARRGQTQLSGWLVEATFDNYQVTPANRAACQAARALATLNNLVLALIDQLAFKTVPDARRFFSARPLEALKLLFVDPCSTLL